MRRLLAIAALLVALPVLLIAGVGADDGGGDGYRVRAIFDNVAAAVPDEDVKIAGAKVGVIESMDVTADKKAAVTLLIEDGRFAPFRGDARCTIRPQSLIGEKFVECDPGTAAAEPLQRIEDGEGEGEHMLSLDRTSSPVDLDLINNTLRRPFRERLAILLAEFGTGLAGRGEDLNEAIHRANPALRETDRVLAILAGQNRVLADLARDSDQALAPLAREKERVSGFIAEANATGQATAARRDDIERGIERLPRFLGELRPLMADLGGFTDEATPVARDLNASGDDVSRLFEQLGPFAEGAQPSLESLGRATVTGRPALISSRPLIRDLADFARNGRPVSTDLDQLTASLDRTGAIERLMDFLYFSTLAVNGFDSAGHYLRAALLVNLCSGYSTAPAGGCEANFTTTRSIRGGGGASSSSVDLEPRLADDSGVRPSGGSVNPGGLPGAGFLGAGPKPSPEGREMIERLRRGAAGNAAPGEPGVPADPAEPVLDYLLGEDGE